MAAPGKAGKTYPGSFEPEKEKKATERLEIAEAYPVVTLDELHRDSNLFGLFSFLRQDSQSGNDASLLYFPAKN